MKLHKTGTTSRRSWRFAAAALTTVLAMGTAACGDGDTGTADGDADTSESAEQVELAALISGTNVPYLATYADAMEAKAEELGAELEIFSAEFDAATQAQQFDQAIASNPDAIIVAAVDAASVVPSLIEADAAGIPVVASNTGVSEEGEDLTAGFTGPDDFRQGRLAAELLIEAIGDEGKVAVVQGALGTTAQINRGGGFEEELAESAPGIEILDQQTANWSQDEARSVADNFLTRFGDELDAIFAQDDTMAAGVAQAIADAGLEDEIAVIGLGGSQLGFDGVRDGSIYGTIIQSPVQDGELAVEAAVAAARGEDIPDTQYIEPIVVTSENVDDYEAEW